VAPTIGPSPTWTYYKLETPSVRIAPNPLLRRMIEGAEGEKRKIEAQDIYNRYYWPYNT
jgi:hypothetical protein